MHKQTSFFIGIIFLTTLSHFTTAEDLRLKITGIGDTEANAVLDAQRNALRTSYGEFVSSNLTILNNELTKNETINLVSTHSNRKVLPNSSFPRKVNLYERGGEYFIPGYKFPKKKIPKQYFDLYTSLKKYFY